jgi:hypothetical protein
MFAILEKNGSPVSHFLANRRTVGQRAQPRTISPGPAGKYYVFRARPLARPTELSAFGRSTPVRTVDRRPALRAKGAGKEGNAGDPLRHSRGGAVQPQRQSHYGRRAAEAVGRPRHRAAQAGRDLAGRARLDRTESPGEGPRTPLPVAERTGGGHQPLPDRRGGVRVPPEHALPPAETRQTAQGFDSGGGRSISLIPRPAPPMRTVPNK